VHSSNPYDPLQVPAAVERKFNYIKDIRRRKFAGMLYKLDESVGEIAKSLQKAGLLRNSIILFTTDNGGPAGGFDLNKASNWPLRGIKHTLWEGGVRGSAFIWSPLLETSSEVQKCGIMGIQDWLPTLYAAAGGNVSDLPAKLDGQNRWNKKCNKAHKYQEIMLHNID